MLCASCGATIDAAMRYCGGCGAASSAPPSDRAAVWPPSATPSGTWAPPPNASPVPPTNWQVEAPVTTPALTPWGAPPSDVPWSTGSPPPAQPPAPVVSRVPQIVSVVLLVLMVLAFVVKITLAYLYALSHASGPATTHLGAIHYHDASRPPITRAA